MEMIIGCIFLSILLVILLIFLKNVTFTIKIEYPEVKFTEIPDPYNSDGELKEQDVRATIDDAVKSINSIMLDMEESDYER